MGKNLVNAARVLFGLILVVMSLNSFFHFFKMPSPGLKAQAYMIGLNGAHVMEIVHIIEIVAGILLIVNYFVPLAIFMLAPIVTNIVLFHLFLAPDGLPVAIVVAALEGFLGVTYWDNFKRIFEA